MASKDSGLPHPLPEQQFLRSLEPTASASEDVGVADPVITSCELIASYNWLDNASRTIVVPGAPPKWLPPATLQRLREDSGQYYRDPNAARYPRWPLAPAVQSIYALDLNFPSREIDIFCCASIWGSLLASVRGEDRTFRFGMHRIANTVFLVRKPNHPQELIENVRGYGHTFPEAYTVWPAIVKGSASHQRIIRYQFGELHCLLRFEGDGYLEDQVPEDVKRLLNNKPTGSGASVDDQLGRMNMAERKGTEHLDDDLVVRLAGTPVPQRAIFDLKTRSSGSAHTVESENFLSRLWTNQTPNFILARHRRGVFHDIDIDIVDAQDRVQRWERDNCQSMRLLHTLLKTLVSISPEEKWSRLEIRRTGHGNMELWSETNEWAALPQEMQKMWARAR
ncbi:uncharacterized protein PV07_12555 [Cladophialophora immunda]|uniref:Geranylgeranyl pyrophosphate synthetase n=1 Tax=Cladophialophora immunda TaxID=569365 RepID=A0A0D2BUI3_9EURO|nr:uncharacterized protein PV07_12555 [Cladophialophora immunda]KIW22050.1 hypothetical protein PV07_12555 [Cladophialophora immunda]